MVSVEAGAWFIVSPVLTFLAHRVLPEAQGEAEEGVWAGPELAVPFHFRNALPTGFTVPPEPVPFSPRERGTTQSLRFSRSEVKPRIYMSHLMLQY